MATYYAGVGGNDGNAGTSWALRKLTIQAAVNVATTAGDTIYVGPGTYRETVTMGTSGTAGNVISLIGDYTGANTSGVKGVVRITGSADDIALTRASCIVASSKNYITIRGFQLDLTSGHVIALTTTTYFTISDCSLMIANFNVAINCIGASQSNLTVTRCVFQMTYNCYGITMSHSAAIDNAGHTISNCIFLGGAFALNNSKVGGVVVSNCSIMFGQYGFAAGYPSALTAGQTLTVNNCILYSMLQTALYAGVLGELVENYNTIFNVATARTNVTAGANSVTRPPLFDARWFFEMVNGGRLVTPFDLASYSTLSEYSSGTGAPSTDLRGASVVGTYREWGALEYDSTLDIEAGSAGGVKTHPGMGGGING